MTTLNKNGDSIVNPASTLQNTPATGPIALWNRIATLLDGWVGHQLIALSSRIAIAAIFFYSARTKVDGLLTIKDSTFTLFAEEYKVPLLPPEFAAHMATYAEHLFPLLLIIGLGTRLSALSLLGMTAVIQIFVYPDAWPTHLTWAVPMLYLIGRGGGGLSLDSRLGIK
jgi:putative oxidoreductase